MICRVAASGNPLSFTSWIAATPAMPLNGPSSAACEPDERVARSSSVGVQASRRARYWITPRVDSSAQ